MSQELASGEHIEVRGFGSFILHFRAARRRRNGKSGDAVVLLGKYVPHYKSGKPLRKRVNNVEHGSVTGSKGIDQPVVNEVETD